MNVEDHNLNRRGFFTATGGISLAAFLAACGGSSSSSSSSSSSAPAAGSSTAAGPKFDPATEPDGPLTVFTWDGYQTGYLKDTPNGMWGPYQTGPYATKSPLTFSILDNDQQALAKVAAGQFYDLIHPCVAYTPDWKNAGLIQPLDETMLPDLKGVPDSILANSKVDGVLYHLPYDVGFSTFSYRPDKITFADGQDSWNVILDPKYKKRIALFGDTVSIIKIGALINEGPINPNTLTQAQIDASKATMIKALPQIRYFWDSQSKTRDDMIAGNIDAAYFWPDGHYGAKQGLAKKGIDLIYSKPKEGRLAWVCGLVMHAETKQPGRAMTALAAANAPASSTWLIDNYQYATAQNDPAVVANVQNKDLIKEFSLDDPSAFAPPQAWFEAYLPNRAAYNKAGEEVKAAAS